MLELKKIGKTAFCTKSYFGLSHFSKSYQIIEEQFFFFFYWKVFLVISENFSLSYLTLQV